MVEATVFIVDDNREMRKALDSFLCAAGLRTENFSSALAFLQVFSPERPGCLLLDVNMPEMSGYELLEALRARGVDLPVIIVSGHCVVRDIVRTMKQLPFEFIE